MNSNCNHCVSYPELKNVEVLLQKMFEKELEADELGPDISNLEEDIDDHLHSFPTQGHSSWHT